RQPSALSTRDREATSQRFMESFNIRGTCIVSMNLLKPRIPTGFRNKAQGWRACEPTLGWRRRVFTTLKGLRQMYATGSPRFMESLLSLRIGIGTMNLVFHGPRLCRIAPCG